jgi:hypothetical protein
MQSNYVLGIFVKSTNYNTNTLSLVIHMVRFKRNLQKNTLALKGGGGGKKHKTNKFYGSKI